LLSLSLQIEFFKIKVTETILTNNNHNNHNNHNHERRHRQGHFPPPPPETEEAGQGEVAAVCLNDTVGFLLINVEKNGPDSQKRSSPFLHDLTLKMSVNFFQKIQDYMLKYFHTPAKC